MLMLLLFLSGAAIVSTDSNNQEEVIEPEKDKEAKEAKEDKGEQKILPEEKVPEGTNKENDTL